MERFKQALICAVFVAVGLIVFAKPPGTVAEAPVETPVETMVSAASPEPKAEATDPLIAIEGEEDPAIPATVAEDEQMSPDSSAINEIAQAGPVHEPAREKEKEEEASGDFPFISTPPENFENKADVKHPHIAIIIDDMGIDHRRSKRAIGLPAAVTLSFLPYSTKLTEQAVTAKAAGHELMLHLPMQPEGNNNPGPHVLTVTQTADEIKKAVSNGLDSFSGFAAVNNHMGSKFTQYRPGLEVLMSVLKEHHVMFVDSKTSPRSIADKVAIEKGVPATERDIFIDHFEDDAHVEAALQHIERLARKKGTVVAIGHPKDVTLTALEKWLPTLKDKGITVVPVTQLIRLRQKPTQSP